MCTSHTWRGLGSGLDQPVSGPARLPLGGGAGGRGISCHLALDVEAPEEAKARKTKCLLTPQPLPAKPPMVPQPHSLLWSCSSCWGKGHQPLIMHCPALCSSIKPSHCPSGVSSSSLTIQPSREIPVGLAVRKVCGKEKLGFLVLDPTRTWPFPGRPTGVSLAHPP